MRMLITAGPTWERIDAVRYIGNRSSGKLGLALSGAATEAGHAVTLLAGPHVPEPVWPIERRVRVHRFESCADLQQLIGEHFGENDVLVMAAAVADYRPVQALDGKRPRQSDAGDGRWDLPLEPTPDLIAQLAATKRPDQRTIAFALEEPAVLEKRAAAKLVGKGVDAIVANPLETMGADAIQPVWITAAGAREAPGRMSKADFARWMLEKIEHL